VDEKSTNKRIALMKIGNKKYDAILMDNDKENQGFIVNTAKKSCIEARNVCPHCGTPVNRHELITCELCGSEVCCYCYPHNQENEDNHEGQQ